MSWNSGSCITSEQVADVVQIRWSSTGRRELGCRSVSLDGLWRCGIKDTLYARGPAPYRTIEGRFTIADLFLPCGQSIPKISMPLDLFWIRLEEAGPGPDVGSRLFIWHH